MNIVADRTRGIAYATIAALCNATIGIFTNIGFRASVQPGTIAFYRCVAAFLAVTMVILIRREKNINLTFVLSHLLKSCCVHSSAFLFSTILRLFRIDILR